MLPQIKKLSSSGFTLIELMICVAIVGILSAISIPLYLKYEFDAKEAEATEMLLAAWKDQQRVRNDCELGLYRKCTGFASDLFEGIDPELPTLYYRPTQRPNFNLILGTTNPDLVPGLDKTALSDFPQYAALPRVNTYGLIYTGLVNGIRQFDRGRFIIGAEGVINGNFHALAIDERGSLRKICDGWSKTMSASGSTLVQTYTGVAASCGGGYTPAP